MIMYPEKMISLGRTVSVSRELLHEAKYHDILIDDAKKQLSYDLSTMITDKFMKETDRDNSVEFSVDAYLIDKDYFYFLVQQEAYKLLDNRDNK